MKIAVFASGSGTNFEAIANHKFHNIEVSLLVSDNPNAYCLERSKSFNIPSKVFIYKSFKRISNRYYCSCWLFKNYRKRFTKCIS